MFKEIRLTGETTSDKTWKKLYSNKSDLLWAAAALLADGARSVLFTPISAMFIGIASQNALSRRSLSKKLRRHFGQAHTSLQINKQPDHNSVTKAEHLAAAKAIFESYSRKILMKTAAFFMVLYHSDTLADSWIAANETAFNYANKLHESGNVAGGQAVGFAFIVTSLGSVSYFVNSVSNDMTIHTRFKKVKDLKWMIEDIPPPISQKAKSSLTRKFGILVPEPAIQAMQLEKLSVFPRRCGSP